MINRNEHEKMSDELWPKLEPNEVVLIEENQECTDDELPAGFEDMLYEECKEKQLEQNENEKAK